MVRLLAILAALTCLSASASHEADSGSAPAFTAAERAFIAAHPVIRYGADRDWPPVDFVDERGRHVGLAAEVLAELSAVTGLHFEWVPLPDWPAVMRAAQERRVDLLPAIIPAPGRERYLNYTVPYLDLFEVVVTRDDGDYVEALGDLQGRRVAMVRGFGTTDLFLRDYPGMQPVLVGTVGEALETVALGRADATTLPLAVANYHIQLRGLTNLRVAAPLDGLRNRLLMGTRKDWPELHSILSKGIVAIDAARLAEIRGRWLTVRNLQQANVLTPVERMAIASIFLLLVLTLMWALSLRRQIARRRAEQLRAEQAEQRLRKVAEAVPGALWQAKVPPGGKFHFTFMSERLIDITGRTGASAVADTVTSFQAIHPEDLPLVQNVIRNLAQAPGREEVRYRIRHETGGDYRWALSTARSHLLPDGTAVIDGLLLDASRIQALEEERDSARRHLQDLADSVPGALWQFRREADGRQHYSYMSEGIRQLTGRTAEQTSALMQAESFVSVHPDDLDVLQSLMERLTECDGIAGDRYRVRTVDGTWKWVQVTARARREPDGALVWNGITLDGSQVKQVEDDLQAARQQMQELINSVPGAVWRLRRRHQGDFRIDYVSDGMIRLSGRPASEHLGDATSTFAMLVPGDRERFVAALDRSVIDGGMIEMELTAITIDGVRKHMSLRADIGQDAGGESVWTGVLIDVSSQRALEAALAEAHARLDDIVANFPGAIWQMKRDLDGHEFFTYMSESITRITGRPAGATLNRPSLPFEVMLPEDRERARQQLYAAIDSEVPVVIDYRLRTAGGEARWVTVTTSARREPSGEVLWSGVVLDAGQQKRLEADLQAARGAAEAASQAKSRFLANMSHEIRTPMNAVIGLSHLAHDAERDPEQRERLAKISRAAKGLLRLLNDILEFSKIEVGKLRLTPLPFVLPELLDTLRLLAGTAAAEKGLQFSIDLDPALPIRLYGDTLRIQQVLLNLLANATKFTDAGSVRMRVYPGPPGADPACPWIAFEVHDTGIGMSEAQLARVFDAFEQADDAISRRHGGTGLGLSIAQELVRLMGGDISVRSQSGQGTRFTVLLPLALAPTLELPPELLSGDTAGQDLAACVQRLAELLAGRDTAARAQVLVLRRQRAALDQADELNALERLLSAYDFESAELELGRLAARWGLSAAP